MNIYRLLKVYRRFKSPKLKLMGILVLHMLRRRYISLYFDPVIACNLRCQMCYFSDPEPRNNSHGKFSAEELKAIEDTLFPHVLRLQIGCGAEPTVSKDLTEIIRTAHRYGVPYISITTNGNLLDKQKLEELYDAGLNELTISAHGFTREIYEKLMTNANFDKFLCLVDALRDLKHQHPDFNIRLNFTVNEDNISSMPKFKEVFKDVYPDEVQIRPIQHIGNSAYKNFSLVKVRDGYKKYIQPLVDFCKENDIICLYPTIDNLNVLENEKKQEEGYANGIVESFIYFYLSPYEGWKEKIDPEKESFKDYCKRTHRVKEILKYLFTPQKRWKDNFGTTKRLNYNIK